MFTQDLLPQEWRYCAKCACRKGLRVETVNNIGRQSSDIDGIASIPQGLLIPLEAVAAFHDEFVQMMLGEGNGFYVVNNIYF